MLAVLIMAVFVLLGSAKARGVAGRRAGQSARKHSNGLILLVVAVAILGVMSLHGGQGKP